MKTLENIVPHCVNAKGLLRLQKLFGLIVVVVVVWWLGCWEDWVEILRQQAAVDERWCYQWNGRAIYASALLYGYEQKAFLRPGGCRRRSVAAAAVAAEWSLSVVGWWCFILCSDACVRRIVAWVFAVSAPRLAAAPHAAEAFCLGNANAAVAASFREKAVAVYGPDKQPWRLSWRRPQEEIRPWQRSDAALIPPPQLALYHAIPHNTMPCIF